MQRQLFGELLHLFLLCLGSLLTLVLIGRGLQLRELFLGLDLGLADAVLLFVYLTPFFMLLVVPVACMLSVFLTFLRMSTDRELIALKAGGVSLYQMLAAPVLFCVLCTLLTLGISLQGLAWGMSHFRATVMEIANSRARVVVQPGVFNKDIPGLTLFARQVDPADSRLSQVIVEDRSRKDATLTILAPTGDIATDEARGELLFRLQNGRLYKTEGQQVSVLGFGEYVVRIDLGQMFKGLDLGEIKPKELSWSQLRALPQDEANASLGDKYLRKVAVELHKRWVFPAACLVLGLFAMPLACAFEGLHRQFGVVLALLMFLVYYSLLSFGLTTGEAGTIPPVVGLWMPNALFLATGLWGLRLAAHERTPAVVSLFSHSRLALRRKRASA
ncbi:LPS export ABC transporter permease LptF [Nitratidesulfovibrio liaohensis]|uniref:LPS export ABC transporter permease LptF n=1 Tax=Nitratidesulfovibrio liaohensis TaxID=2604158 RepID=UPI001FBB32D6|nr:LPS export ABC transporter permease LptF [Nitratidesulfovibrio liaohensis]